MKNPDYFGSGDCAEAQFGLWKHQFSNRFTFGDDRFKALLESAERQVRESDMGDFSAEGKALSRKLYRILTSSLKGPALSIARAVRETENGFLVWRWGHECPNRMVNQAETSATAETASTHAPSSSSGSASKQDRRVIRQVKMFHIRTPPSTLPEAIEVCTSDEEIEVQWCRMVQEFPLTESELPEGSLASLA